MASALFDGLFVGLRSIRCRIRLCQTSMVVLRLTTLMLLQLVAIDRSRRCLSLWWRLVVSKWIKISSLINLREWPGLLLFSSFVRAPMLMCDLGSKLILSSRHQLADRMRLARSWGAGDDHNLLPLSSFIQLLSSICWVYLVRCFWCKFMYLCRGVGFTCFARCGLPLFPHWKWFFDLWGCRQEVSASLDTRGDSIFRRIWG